MWESTIITAVIGAAAGVIGGWFLARHSFRSTENVNLINDHIKDVECFADKLLEHWTTSFQKDKTTHRCEIAKVKSLHVSITSFYGEARQRLGTESYRNYEVLQLKLFKIGMGGNFETVGRHFCLNTAIETQRLSWELIQSLRIARKKQYSLLGFARHKM